MRIETESKRFLAPEVSTLNPGDAFFELSQEFRDLISRRAYELFELRGSVDGHDREDWLQAVSEILLDVQVDVVETETGLTDPRCRAGIRREGIRSACCASLGVHYREAGRGIGTE